MTAKKALKASLLLLIFSAALMLVPAALASEAEAEAGNEEKVTLYMTDWCGWCRKTSNLLTDLDIEFRSVDIEKDAAGKAEFLEKGNGRGGVPLIDIDGTIIRGYDEDRIRELVSQLQEAG
ncbi:MAG: glutaredoxin domain-containing protein [Acidobacteriota bacterium]